MLNQIFINIMKLFTSTSGSIPIKLSKIAGISMGKFSLYIVKPKFYRHYQYSSIIRHLVSLIHCQYNNIVCHSIVDIK